MRFVDVIEQLWFGRILADADYNKTVLENGEWGNMMFLPIVTRHGTFVLQAAGKENLA